VRRRRARRSPVAHGRGRSSAGTNPPVNPAHRNSFGKDRFPNNADPTDTNLYSLVGGLVGGPNQNAQGSFPAGYEDVTSDYSENEGTRAAGRARGVGRSDPLSSAQWRSTTTPPSWACRPRAWCLSAVRPR
jgi:hypothetical protein